MIFAKTNGAWVGFHFLPFVSLLTSSSTSVKKLTHQNFINEKHSGAEFKMGWLLNFFYLYFFKVLGWRTAKWAWPMEVTIPCHHLNRVNLWLQTFKEICYPLISDLKHHTYIWFYDCLIMILCCLDLLHSPHIQ